MKLETIARSFAGAAEHVRKLEERLAENEKLRKQLEQELVNAREVREKYHKELVVSFKGRGSNA